MELEMGWEDSYAAPPFFLWSERVTAAIFTLEYLVRWRYSSRGFRFPLKPLSLIDLAAILPFYVGFFVDRQSLQLIRTLRVLRLLKLYRHNEAMQSFVASFRAIRDRLYCLGSITVAWLIFSSVAIYQCESRAQPDKFAKFSDCLWWAIVTLTTIGYGDMFPITGAGRIVAAVAAILGISIITAFMGLIGGALAADAFEKELSDHE